MGDPVEIDTARIAEDQRSAYDRLRDRSPVARLDDAWVLLGHAEVMAAALDPATYSSNVTARRAIPNSLDGAEHAAYRAVVDRFLTRERVDALEAGCRAQAVAIVDGLPREVTVKTIAGIGVPYAVRAQSQWLGWPVELEEKLVEWMAENHAATRSGDRSRTAEVAERFDRLIQGLLDERRGRPPGDVTGELMLAEVDGRPLTDEELVSILRNWTAGDLGSLATSVGVIVHFLGARAEVQRQLRDLVEAGSPGDVEAALHEILRIDDPFVSNRRVTTREVDVAGHRLGAGERVLLNWTSANRDPRVFGDPDEFDPAAHEESNLVFGIGPHVCPGKDLTLMELRVVVEELLRRTDLIELATDRPAVRETPPVGGWARVPVVLRGRGAVGSD